MTKFEDLKRLILWHGRSFGYRASSYTMFFAFKGMLFSIPILFFNTICAYSGLTYVLDLYYALYEVLMTTFAIAFYLMIDTDVSFKNPPTTFSISKLYSYRIESHLNKKIQRYAFWTCYCWYCGAVIFYIPFYTMTRITNREGMVGGLWGAGYCAFASLITIHHL